MRDFSVVLLQADNAGLLEKELVPKDFFQADPQQIYASFLEYSKANPETKKEPISTKLSQSRYSSPYQIYHDIRLVASQEIVNHKVGTETYKNIDFFYKLTTELLIRETQALGLLLFDNIEISDSEEAQNILKDDYIKISSSYFTDNSEVVTFLNKIEETVPSYHSVYSDLPQQTTHVTTQPLFSSLIGKSPVDSRNTIVPDPYQLAKVISAPKPQDSTNNTLKSFTGSLLKPPGAPQGNTQILDRFFFPNWYTIEAPKWLLYKQKSLKPPVESTLVKETNTNELRTYEKRSQTIRSFGPNTDSRNSVLTETLKNSVWFNQIGSEQINKYRRAYLQSKDPEAVKSEVVAPKDDVDDHVSTPDEHETPPPSPSPLDEDAVIPPTTDTVKLENLLQYSPEQLATLDLIKKDREEIIKSPEHLQRVISVSLLKLNKLRQDRFSRGSATSDRSPAIEERILYRKIMKLMTILLKSQALQDAEFAYNISRKLPVLTHDYPGTLPGPAPSRMPPSMKSSRLPGIRGPHKRRGLR